MVKGFSWLEGESKKLGIGKERNEGVDDDVCVNDQTQNQTALRAQEDRRGPSWWYEELGD